MEHITTGNLRHMGNREGLILQGCGGELQEWVDGINDLLTEAGILLDGAKFEQASVFQHDGMTNLLFPFESVKLDMGRLAVWRLQTHELFGGTWLSDYVTNKLGGFLQDQTAVKPDCPLIGEDGNIFNLIAIASRTLRENGQAEQAKEMRERIIGGEGKDYYAALNIIGEYVTITAPTDEAIEMKMTFGGM